MAELETKSTETVVEIQGQRRRLPRERRAGGRDAGNGLGASTRAPVSRPQDDERREHGQCRRRDRVGKPRPAELDVGEHGQGVRVVREDHGGPELAEGPQPGEEQPRSDSRGCQRQAHPAEPGPLALAERRRPIGAIDGWPLKPFHQQQRDSFSSQLLSKRSAFGALFCFIARGSPRALPFATWQGCRTSPATI